MATSGLPNSNPMPLSPASTAASLTLSSPLPMAHTNEYLPSISVSPGVIYSTAHALWSAQELQLLRRGLAEFRAEDYDNVTRYIKIAATLPGKCVRDVAFKVRALWFEGDTDAGVVEEPLQSKRARLDASAEEMHALGHPLEDAQLNALFQDNVLAINVIRTNLLNGKGSDNREMMLKFQDNCHALTSAIADICSTIPPLPIQVDISLVSSADSQQQHQ